MPHSRLQPKIAANGKVGLRLSPEQRDILLRAGETPKGLAHRLKRAPVRNGKLELRVTHDELDMLIAGAAHAPTADRATKRALDVFIDYLEDQAERFAEPETDVG